MTKLTFQALPRAQFAVLQQRVFPLYFRIQVGLLFLVALTHPPTGLVSLSRRLQDWMSLGIALGASVLNLSVNGPRTEKLMVARWQKGEYLGVRKSI